MNGIYEIEKINEAGNFPLTPEDLAVKRANKKAFYDRWGYN